MSVYRRCLISCTALLILSCWQASAKSNFSYPSLVDCDFEDSTFCDWENDKTGKATFKWAIRSGRTPSWRTGPQQDVSGNGKYAYLEASAPRQHGDTVRLVSPTIHGENCMSFMYHMHGTSVGSLIVFMKTNISETVEWVKSGNNPDRWFEAAVFLNSSIEYQIVLEGTRGRSWAGDVAVDNIKMNNGACKRVATQTLYAFTKEDASVFKLDRVPAHSGWIHQFTLQALQTKNSSKDVMYFVYPADTPRCAKSVTRQLLLADLYCFPRDFFYASSMYQAEQRKILLINRGKNMPYEIALEEYHPCCGQEVEEQFFANVLLPQPSLCPSGWRSLDESCFQLHMTYWRTWSSYRFTCHNLGGHLGVLKDTAKQSTITAFFDEYLEEWDDFYLGAYAVSSGRWMTVKKQPFASTSPLWALGGPGEEGWCTELYYSQKFVTDQVKDGWAIIASHCFYKRIFVCQKGKNAAGSKCDIGWFEADNTCFRVFSERKSWVEARQHCTEQNSDLAIVDSEMKRKIIASQLTERACIGIGLLGSWHWLDGRNIPSIIWNSGQPLTFKGGSCVVLKKSSRDWKLAQVSCLENHASVCETSERNFVAGQPTSHSSQVSTMGKPYHAIDGNIASCFTIKRQNGNPLWWSVSLDRRAFVYKIWITNRPDRGFTEMPNLEVVLRNSEQTERANCKAYDWKAKQRRLMICQPSIMATNVTLFADTADNLTLCEVLVNSADDDVIAHGVLQEVWYDIPSTTIASLQADRRYPSNPDVVTTLRTFDPPNEFSDLYGQRLTAYLQVPVSGNYTFYLACDDTCELWLDTRQINQPDSEIQDEERGKDLLAKLVEDEWTEHQQWDKYPDKQTSGEILLSKCFLYPMETLMKERQLSDSVSVGMRLPNGTYDRPIGKTHLFWVWPGVKYVDFKINSIPEKVSVKTGDKLFIQATYKYCCRGAYCPRCPIDLFIKFAGRNVLVQEGLALDCRERNFAQNFETLLQEETYKISITYALLDSGTYVSETSRDVAEVYISAIDLGGCSFLSDLCSWSDKDQGWKLSKSGKGILAHVNGNAAVLESPQILADSIYHTTGLCLSFSYQLPTQDSGSSLSAVLVSSSNSTIWSLSGYQGSAWLTGQVSFLSREDFKIVIVAKGESSDTYYAAVDDINISSKRCVRSPPHSAPGFRCEGKSKFQCENGQCISKDLVCDGDPNCVDKSDERNCRCLTSQFECPTGECLTVDKLCDSRKNCGDRTDEARCGTSCSEDQFSCVGGGCVSRSETCDGENNCEDGTDEPSICGFLQCSLLNLTCAWSNSTDPLNARRCLGNRVKCDFEDGLCGMKHESKLRYWQIGSDSTPTKNTGPNYDHTTFSPSGKYMFLEASDYKKGGTAVLASNAIDAAKATCAQFWYHMKGGDIGSLNVYIQTNESKTLVWNRTGEQGDYWNFGQVGHKGDLRSYKVILEGVLGNGIHGDIAVDDFCLLEEEECQTIYGNESPNCLFELDHCAWKPSKTWKMSKVFPLGSLKKDWQKIRGGYTYFQDCSTQTQEARCYGSLLSPPIFSEAGWKCIQFWYYLGIGGTSSLQVSLVFNESQLTLWNSDWSQRKPGHWSYARLPIDSASNPFQVLFEGRKDFRKTIIGLDDIAFQTESCEIIPWQGDTKDFGNNPLGAKYFWKLDGTDKNIWLRGKASYQIKGGFKSLSLNGQDGYADIPTIDFRRSNFSIAIRFNAHDVHVEGHLISDWSSPFQFRVVIYDRTIQVVLQRSGHEQVLLHAISREYIKSNVWTHLVFVWNRSTLKGKIYIDGKFDSETTSTYKGSDIDLNLTNHTLYELGFRKDTKGVLNGYLRDLAVFLRPLTPGEVFTLYSPTRALCPVRHTTFGDCCDFPFLHKNIQHNTCTSDDTKDLWCPAKSVSKQPTSGTCAINIGCLEFQEGFCGWVNSNQKASPWRLLMKAQMGSLTSQVKSYLQKTGWNEMQDSVIGSNYQLDFAENHAAYVNVTDLPDLSEFTTCLWMKTTDKTSAGAPIWYRVFYEMKRKYVTAIALLDYRGFYVYVGETFSTKTSSKANDGKWHHICLTWNSASGRVYFYNDKAVLTGTPFSKGKIIPGGGEFLVGLTNDQARVDRKAGEFIGVISSVNIFNKALGGSEIEKLSHKCGENLLNAIVPWSKFSAGFVGDVKFWKPAECSHDKGYRYVIFGNGTSHSSQVSAFESPMYERSNESPFVCVRFRYIMYGPGKRVLRLNQQLEMKHQSRSLMWAVGESNNMDETWKEGKVAVPSVTKYKVSFEADLANEPGYVGVRNIHIDKEYCHPFPLIGTEECNRNFTNSSGYIFSPHYPSYYPPLSRCRWTISVPQGNVIKLRFLEFQLEEHPSCLNDFVEIYSGQAKARRKIGRYCGQRYPDFLESLSNVLEITFVSNANITRSGLKLHYTSWKAKTDQTDCIQYEDCPSSLECNPISPKSQEMLITVKEGRELAAVPEQIPSDTAMILFQRNQISHLQKKTFFTLSWLKYLDLSENRIFRIERRTFSNCYSLATLKLGVNFISTLSGGVLENMRSLETLDCSSNLIKAISSPSLASLSSLTTLSLRENRINRIDKDAFNNTTKLKHLYLQGNVLEDLPDEVFVGLATLKILYLNNNRIKRLSSKTFSGLSSLEKLNLQSNSLSLKDFPPGVFDELPNLKEINLDEFILCCYAEKSQPGVRCNSPKDEFSSCSDLMKNRGVQVCVWILGLTALVGNLFVILMRVIVKEDNKVHSFLLTNLAISDLLMGVYLLIIAIKDAQWQGEYFKHDFDWRSGATCAFTGVLSMVSSEVSVLMLTLITTDRLICIVFPFKVRRMSRSLAYVVVGAIWVFGIMISVIPTLGFDYFHDHKRNVGFFGKSAVCLPLQLSTQRQAGWEYAVAIFIALNFASFIYILVAYLVMFFTVRHVSNQVRSTNMKRESQMARRMVFIVVTDFLCWMPVIILSLLSLLGEFHDPEKQAYVWIAVFVLPVNSSINPILYTFSTPLMRKKFGQQRDSLRGVMERLGQRLKNFPGIMKDTRLNSLLSRNMAKTSQTALALSSSQSSIPSTSIRSLDERLASEKDLKLIEIPSVFPQETSPSVGFVVAWSKCGKDASMRLIKHFANERENTWRKEAELLEELNAGRGHPNILKYRWHCRTGECALKIEREKFPLLKDSSFLLCYDFTSCMTLYEYLQNSKIVLSLDTLLAVAMDLICAIKYLEYNGVVHNNITTSSVLIGRGFRVPPITAILGGFGSAQRVSEDFPECSTHSHSMKNILGKNILQFGFVLSELVKNCREAEEFEELHEVMNFCFEQDADVRPNVSQLRDLLENLWFQNDVWDTTL